MSYIGNSPGVASQRVTTTLTATAGQTQFTTQSGYVLGYVDVYLNGAKLVNGADFEAITGTYITLFAGAAVGDVVELVSYVPRGLTDGYTKAEADAKFLDVGGDTASGSLSLASASLTGNLTLSGGTANGVAYLNGSKVLTSGSGLTTNGTSLGVGSSSYGDAGTISLSVGLPGTTAGGLQLWASSAQEHYIQWGDGTSGSDTYRGAISYSHANDFMRFWTSSTEQMRLTSTGLGVGTSTPEARLTVIKDLTSGGDATGFRLNANSTANRNILFGGPSTTLDASFWQAYKEATVGAGVRNLLLQPIGGNVGIGTSNPTQKLVVYDAGTVYSITETGNAGAYAIILAKNPNNDLYLWNRGDNNTSALVSTAWDMQIRTDAAKYISFATNATERARIDSSGRMQLGTTSMSDVNGSRLTVAATFPMTPVEIRSDSTSGHYAAVFYNPFGLIGQIQTNGNDFVIGGAGANQNLLFTTGNGTPHARIDSIGRFLIGSNTASGGLAGGAIQVGSGFSGITNTGSAIAPTILTSGSLEFNFDGVSGTQRHGRITGTAGNGAGSAYGGGLNFEYYAYDGSSTYQWYTGFALDGAGRLGIGTTSPAAKLDIKMSGDGDIFVGRHHASAAKLVYAYQSGSDGYLELRTGADQIVTKLSGYAGTASYFKSNVGIGTTAPAVALEVRDRARFGDGTNTLTIGYWDSANNRIESVNKPLLLTTYSGDIVMGISGGTTAIVTSTSLNVNGSVVPNYLAVGSLVSSSISSVPQGITRYTFSIPADNAWRTLVSNFNDHAGEFIITISDTASGDVATYVARTTSPAYGVANMQQTYYMEGGWNTGAFEVQFLNIGGTYALQVRYTSYYTSSNVGSGNIQFTRF